MFDKSVKKFLACGMLVTFLIIGFQYFSKKSVNEISKDDLIKIKGVGDVKAEFVIKDRNDNGTYKDFADFEKRTKGVIGQVVIDRIRVKYKI